MSDKFEDNQPQILYDKRLPFRYTPLKKVNRTTYGNDVFWIFKPNILYEGGRFIEFIPNMEMSYIERLNSITRFCIYSIIVLFIFKRKSILIPTLFFIIVMIIFMKKIPNLNKMDKVIVRKEMEKKKCTKPTFENPFMNVLLNEYVENPDRPEACSVDDPVIKNGVEDNFYKNLFRDVGDVYGKMNSQRQFFTMPNTKIPNDQKKIAMWLYGITPSCKDGNTENCRIYEEPRMNRQIFPNPNVNPVNVGKRGF